MNHFQRVAVLGSVDGNTMAHWADRDRDIRHRAELAQMEKENYCLNCGRDEAELHDGICVKCICEEGG